MNFEIPDGLGHHLMEAIIKNRKIVWSPKSIKAFSDFKILVNLQVLLVQELILNRSQLLFVCDADNEDIKKYLESEKIPICIQAGNLYIDIETFKNKVSNDLFAEAAGLGSVLKDAAQSAREQKWDVDSIEMLHLLSILSALPVHLINAIKEGCKELPVCNEKDYPQLKMYFDDEKIPWFVTPSGLIVIDIEKLWK